MTTMTMHRARSNVPLFLLFVMAAILGWMMLASVHAVMRHGTAAIDAQNCFSGKGMTMKEVRYEPGTFRKMSFCQMGGHWFISVDACDGGNVTCYPRSFAKCLRDVIRYAEEHGFTSKVFPQ
jgi:hypothetical protein